MALRCRSLVGAPCSGELQKHCKFVLDPLARLCLRRQSNTCLSATNCWRPNTPASASVALLPPQEAGCRVPVSGPPGSVPFSMPIESAHIGT